ncbi:hypothetical protein FOB58_000615 [Candida parapsilosis]|uniref:Uncharacterized protein n=2 Tax=Candida parapsilosis TaxID=5480 RepID=G8BD12_CANPC|nr:uncharacterized protein CPAR2_208000 [Candida parapsilosis]KAF6054693.1 hypothetical protein FOB58_000615 [Candida parapsilosis]KAF6056281.1 hypothetical protein FOB59_000793 [Candida parapsilosis]KAF6059214.1 hypothetical protein FOB60_000796 [Candida parapsilosis]KAF6067971.1 hypothetical protein FOB61_000796 [Candida parapsilosis]KAI5905489.1 hypothetical protein K4G60_g4749 [Candida parapsilosis]
MTASTQDTGKLDSQSSIKRNRQPTENNFKLSQMNGSTSNNKQDIPSPDQDQLLSLTSKHNESWQLAMAKQLEDEENFSPFPCEDDDNSTDPNPILNYNMSEALESVPNQAGETIQEVPNAKVHHTNLSSLQQIDPSKRPRRRIICPPPSFLHPDEIDYIRDKITRVIEEKGVGQLPKDFNLFDSENNSIHLQCDDDDLSKSSGRADNCQLNRTSIEIKFSQMPECEIHGEEDCDCPIFDETCTSSRLSSKGSSDLRYADCEDGKCGPSCELTFEYDSSGRLVPTGTNIEEKLKSITNEASKLKQLKDELNSIICESSESQALVPTNKLQNRQQPPSSSSSKSSSKRKISADKKPKRVITDPLDDLKILVKDRPQAKLEKCAIRNRRSTTPQNYYGLIPNDSCCLSCQYEAVFGTKPRYLVAKNAS